MNHFLQSEHQNQDNDVLLASQYLRIQRMMLLLVNIYTPTNHAAWHERTVRKDFFEELPRNKGTKTMYGEWNDMMDQ